MSTLVHLVRHASHAELGDVLSGRSDIGLSAEGRRQAAAAARLLAGRGIAAIHASPRRRALETAGFLAEETGLSVEEDAALDEIDFGRWTGRRFAELAADPEWDRWNAERAVALPPEGEGMAAATARARASVDRIAAAATGPVALVSHCDIIRGVVADVLGLPLGRLLAFDVDPASVTTLSVGSWGARVISLNERAA